MNIRASCKQLVLLVQGEASLLKHSVMSIAWFYAKCGVKKKLTTYMLTLLCCMLIFFSAIALRRRKVSSDIQLRTSEAAAAEKVRYSTGGSVVRLGQNQNLAYEAVEYPDEAIYECPT